MVSSCCTGTEQCKGRSFQLFLMLGRLSLHLLSACGSGPTPWSAFNQLQTAVHEHTSEIQQNKGDWTKFSTNTVAHQHRLFFVLGDVMKYFPQKDMRLWRFPPAHLIHICSINHRPRLVYITWLKPAQTGTFPSNEFWLTASPPPLLILSPTSADDLSGGREKHFSCLLDFCAGILGLVFEMNGPSLWL